MTGTPPYRKRKLWADLPLDSLDGISASELFSKAQGYTYDDIILLPGQITFAANDVDISSAITRNIRLRTPFVASPMDTVSESKMGIAMALQGGIAIMHHNCSVKLQSQMVDKVKRYKNGFITDPKVLAPTATVADVLAIKARYGFTGVPITEDGQVRPLFVKLVRRLHLVFCYRRCSER
jgi:IMP dehydrogenase